MNQLIIFDFDGVLVDTEYTTFLYYKELLSQYDIVLKESDFQHKMGRKSIDFFKDVLKEKFEPNLVKQWIENKRRAFLANVTKHLKPLPGAFNLIKNCRKAGIKLAIGSQNERDLIEKAVDIFDIRKYFGAIISIADIKNKKPDPEIFLLATSRSGISPQKSVIIEDSPDGIEAAKKIEAKTVGVTSSFPREKLKKADIVVGSLLELSPDLLKNL